MSNELKTLFCVPEKREVFGQEMEFTQIKLAQVPDLIELFAVVDSKREESAKTGKPLNIKEVVSQVIGSNQKVIYNLISSCTSLKFEEVQNLNIAAAIKIAQVVMEVNWDFLEQHILPAIESAGKRIEELSVQKQATGQG